MITLKNVLVATDFGDASHTALAYGRDLARTFGATLHVLHVVDDVRARAMGSEGYTIELADVQRAVETWARDQLDSIVHDDDRRELGATVVLRTSVATASASTTRGATAATRNSTPWVCAAAASARPIAPMPPLAVARK